MTELLLRLFVKNNHLTQNSTVRASIGTFAGIVGIVCNAILFLLKLSVGLLSGSISVLADAFNNLSDAASSVTTLLGFRMARQPADRDHPFGHARYEYLAGLAVAALILLIGVELGESAIQKILHPQALTVSNATLAVMFCAIAIKLWMSLFFRKLGRKIDSTALLATADDSRNDVIASGAVLLSCLCARLWNIYLDGFIGLAVAIFIFLSGLSTAKQTISPLLGQQADQALLSQITKLILRHDKVLGVHDLLVHDYGPGQCFASVHVEISAAEDPLHSHDIIDDIERDALAELNVHLVIHYDPVLLTDPEQMRLQQLLDEIIRQIHPDLSFHDFRLLRYARHKKLYFDLEVPYDLKLSHEELARQIDEQLHQLESDCHAVISFDGK